MLCLTYNWLFWITDTGYGKFLSVQCTFSVCSKIILFFWRVNSMICPVFSLRRMLLSFHDYYLRRARHSWSDRDTAFFQSKARSSGARLSLLLFSIHRCAICWSGIRTDGHFPSKLLFIVYVEEEFIQTLEMHEALEVPKQKLKSPRIEFKHVLLFSSLAQIQCFHYLLFWGLDKRNKRHPKNRIQRSG